VNALGSTKEEKRQKGCPRPGEKELFERLEEGYSATRDEGLEISREFEAADLENWDEY